MCGLISPVQAAVQTNIGTLTCTLVESNDQEAAAGSDREKSAPSQSRIMLCSFKPSGTGPEEHYTGEIKSVGSNEALSGKLVLIWVVMGPDHVTFAPGLLQQTYVGNGPASDRAKPKAPTLIGESDESFALRPLNESETSGANSVTVISLKVKSTPA
jgi:hypothetical protein